LPIVEQSFTIAYLLALRATLVRKWWLAKVRLAEEESGERVVRGGTGLEARGAGRKTGR